MKILKTLCVLASAVIMCLTAGDVEQRLINSTYGEERQEKPIFRNKLEVFLPDNNVEVLVQGSMVQTTIGSVVKVDVTLNLSNGKLPRRGLLDLVEMITEDDINEMKRAISRSFKEQGLDGVVKFDIYKHQNTLRAEMSVRFDETDVEELLFVFKPTKENEAVILVGQKKAVKELLQE